MRLRYLPKQRGGRLPHVATFTQVCDARIRADAEWMMEETLQAYDEAVEETFGFVGLASLKETPCVIKIMEWGAMADKEIHAQQWFRSHPYRHIVQGICHFNCKDSVLRWTSRLPAPQAFCVSGDTTMRIIVQEYIQGGDLNQQRVWTLPLWRSIVLQLTFVCFEFYEMGFQYGDWNFGNILIDATTETHHLYQMFGKTKRIPTEGICPVLTDFARSVFFPDSERSLTLLVDTIGIVWGLLRLKCPDNELKQWLNEQSVRIGHCTSKTAIQKTVNAVQTHLNQVN